MREIPVATWSGLGDRRPAHALVENVDLVVVRHDDRLSVFYGRCPHRGALLSDGHCTGRNLVCGLHFWDFRLDTGVSEYNNADALPRFTAWVRDDTVCVDADEVAAWAQGHPQPFERDAYLGAYADTHPEPGEPHVGTIQALARGDTGRHGPVAAMGVPRDALPQWDSIQIVTAQLARPPLLEATHVATDVQVGPAASRPLELAMPLMVTDMSFGALSAEAKTALARGAERAGTAIASGEGGYLAAERAENQRYMAEVGPGRFGFDPGNLQGCGAFHFKLGQAAKTGVGSRLPGDKVTGEIAEVRGARAGEPVDSPARFPDWTEPQHFRAVADQVRAAAGGIPVGFKLSAQHVEADLDAAVAAGADYVIVDGRGGGTGAAPVFVRDHIGIPTIPALARARRHLDHLGRDDVTLVVTGGLRTPPDVFKALALGADVVALGNAALQAIGCQGMRACETDNCPVGIATQKPHLRARLDVETAAERLATFLSETTRLLQTLARACGHIDLGNLRRSDLVTADSGMARLAGIPYAGVGE